MSASLTRALGKTWFRALMFFVLALVASCSPLGGSDPRGSLEFDSDSVVVAEGDSVTLAVARSGGSAGEATVYYHATPDSALASSDYDLTGGMLTWPDGDDTTKTITVTTVADEEVEQDESFAVVVFKPSGATLGSATTVAVLIQDDDVYPTPSVQVTEPASGSVDVPVDTDISVQFSESMDRASVENVFGTSPDVTCSFSWSEESDVVTCAPGAPLSLGTVYGVTIGATARSAAGVALGSAHAFEFTTIASAAPSPPPGPIDSAPPVVESTVPVYDAVGVSLEATIEIAFSEEMDRARVEAALVASPGVDCQFSWSVAGDRVTCDPVSNLTPSTRYTFTIDTGATDLAGNPLLSAHQFSFSTAVDPSQPPTAQACVLGSGVLGQCKIGN